MPTYEYHCDACGADFELFQSITAKPVRKCPKCGKGSARRLIGTGAGIIFKGCGFYTTDYRSDSYKKAAEKDTPPAKDASDDKAGKAKPDAEAKKPKDKKPSGD